MLKLYYSPGSSSMAAHIALHEVGVPFERHMVSVTEKTTRSPDYLAINPEGKVPTLIIDGRPLTEVAGILFYLAKRFPEAALLPKDDIELEARIVSWMSFIASTIHPARQKGFEHCVEVYKIAEARFGDRDWITGQYSIADIHLFRLYWRFIYTFKKPGLFPKLDALYARMMARPAVKKTFEAEAGMENHLP